MSDPTHDPIHDTVGDRLRLLGTQLPAPALPAAEIRRRADRRRHRRHALGAAVACTTAALCLALPSAPHSAEPQQGAVTTDASPASASPHPTAALSVASTKTVPIEAGA
ncbi:hypothetical protein AB0F71_39895, partial [Kitasatospora sp. NPDC028055]